MQKDRKKQQDLQRLKMLKTRMNKGKTSISAGFWYGGPEGIRTLGLRDANELKALIYIDFQTFPALSAGM